LDGDPHAPLLDAVGVEEVREADRPVRPARDLLPYEALRVVDDPRHDLAQRARVVAVGELAEPALSDRARRDLRPEIAHGHRRDPDVRADDPEDVVDRLASRVEPPPRGGEPRPAGLPG